jgi:hypothetical protein
MAIPGITENWSAFMSPGGLQMGKAGGGTIVASAIAMPAPTQLITTVSGTAAMTTLGIPWPGFTGIVIFIPTGIVTAATGGTATSAALPFGAAYTFTVNIPTFLVCDGSNWWCK